MIRKRVPKLLTILATTACIFGFVLVTPADTPTLSPMPTASADVLPNGYDVNCKKANENQVICTVAGCPRVSGVYAGDELHTHINGDAANGKESDKACDQTYSETIDIDPNKPFTYSVQGVRHRDTSKDLLSAYSDYQYVPPPAPVQAPINCGPNSKTATVVPPAQCEAAPVAAQAPPKNCPEGSVAAQVPADQQCKGPTDAVTLSVTQEGLNANVAVTNKSTLPADCTYTATKTRGILGPASVTRNVSVGPNSTGNITDLLWPAPLVSYSATAKCTATYDGKQVTIGETAPQTVSG